MNNCLGNYPAIVTLVLDKPVSAVIAPNFEFFDSSVQVFLCFAWESIIRIKFVDGIAKLSSNFDRPNSLESYLVNEERTRESDV